jgi:hypothetical protein
VTTTTTDYGDDAPEVVDVLPSPLLKLEPLIAEASTALAPSRFYASLVATSTYRSARAAYGLCYDDDARLPHRKHMCGAETALGMMTTMGGGRDTRRLHLIPMRLWGELESLFAICRIWRKRSTRSARCWQWRWRRRTRKNIGRRRSGG